MSGRSTIALLGMALSVLSPGASSSAEARGYTPRACGFDMDRDGIVGEPEDCFVCDATVVAGNIVAGTTDPDGDLNDEDLIYTDCDNGTNAANCGLPGEPPCLTLAFAFTQSDGNGDGTEEIFCFKGTCNEESLNLANGGVAGTYSIAASGNQTRAWLYPQDPVMLVGWDADGDGSYPPFDTDDTAILDGFNDKERTFILDGTDDYLEMAHFSVADYGHLAIGSGVGKNMGFMAPDDTDYIYLHDIEAEGINSGRSDLQSCGGDSGVSAFNVFGIAGGLQYFLLDNVTFTNYGSYWMRGSAGNADVDNAGPIRVQNSTFTAHGEDACSRGPTLVKLWGYIDGYEFLDNIVDGNVGAWDATERGAQGITAAQCARDFDIVNNTFTEMVLGVRAQCSAAGACENAAARTVTDITVSNNDFTTTTALDNGNTFRGVVFMDLTDGGDSAGESCENITITNNTISCSNDCQSCFFYDQTFSGPSQPGTYTYSNNDCTLSDLATGSGLKGSIVLDDRAVTLQNSFVIHDNEFNGHATGELAMHLRYIPSAWDSDDNCFDPDADYIWNDGSATDFATWQTNSGGDANSVTVDPCPVPEPSGYSLGLAALVTLALLKSSPLRQASRRARRLR